MCRVVSFLKIQLAQHWLPGLIVATHSAVQENLTSWLWFNSWAFWPLVKWNSSRPAANPWILINVLQTWPAEVIQPVYISHYYIFKWLISLFSLSIIMINIIQIIQYNSNLHSHMAGPISQSPSFLSKYYHSNFYSRVVIIQISIQTWQGYSTSFHLAPRLLPLQLLFWSCY